MKAITICAVLAVALTVVVAAPHSNNQEHIQGKLRAAQFLNRNRLHKSPLPLRSSGTHELDRKALNDAVVLTYNNIDHNLYQTLPKITSLLTNEEDSVTRNQITNAFDHAMSINYDIYYYFAYYEGSKTDEEIPSFVTEIVGYIQEFIIQQVTWETENILKEAEKELLDQVQAIDQQLIADINSYIQPLLDIISQSKQ